MVSDGLWWSAVATPWQDEAWWQAATHWACDLVFSAGIPVFKSYQVVIRCTLRCIWKRLAEHEVPENNRASNKWKVRITSQTLPEPQTLKLPFTFLCCNGSMLESRRGIWAKRTAVQAAASSHLNWKPRGLLAPNATRSHFEKPLSTGFIGTLQNTSRILADCNVELWIITP